MKRLYETIRRARPQGEPAFTYPGFTLSETIDQFYEQGVVPDFLPADLGEDKADEFDEDGFPIVDPDGNIRVSRLQRLESGLFNGLVDPDDPSPASPADPSSVPPADPE